MIFLNHGSPSKPTRCWISLLGKFWDAETHPGWKFYPLERLSLNQSLIMLMMNWWVHWQESVDTVCVWIGKRFTLSNVVRKTTWSTLSEAWGRILTPRCLFSIPKIIGCPLTTVVSKPLPTIFMKFMIYYFAMRVLRDMRPLDSFVSELEKSCTFKCRL